MRRVLCWGLAAIGVVLSSVECLAGEREMHGVLVHLGLNMWGRHDHPRDLARKGPWWGAPSDEHMQHLAAFYQAGDEVRFDEATWREVSEAYQRQGVNTIVLDLGEAVVYPSHPELAVKGSWSVAKLRAEKRRLEAMGFEVLPKLNFSTAHDAWLKDYGQMVSTPAYYKVCADLIADVCEMFDRPRLFHLGLDEETADEPCCGLLVARFGNLWWHDLDFYDAEVKKHGSRAWIWVDGIVQKAEKTRAFERLPKDVLLSPWYYGGEFDASSCWELKAMHGLNANGYEMVLCGSNCFGTYDSLELLADYARVHLNPRLVKGYLTAPWLRMEPFFKDRWIASGESLMRAVRAASREPKCVRTRVLADSLSDADNLREALREVRGAADEVVLTVAGAAEREAARHAADALRESGVDVSIRLNASRVTTNDIRALVADIRPHGVWFVDDLPAGTNKMARAKALRPLAEAVHDLMPACEVAVEHGREGRAIVNSYVAAELGIRKNIIACPDEGGRPSDVAELVRSYGKPAFVKDWAFAVPADAPSAAFAALASGMDSLRFSLKGRDAVHALADIRALRPFWNAFAAANRGALPFREYAAQRLALDGREVDCPVSVRDGKTDGLAVLPFMRWNGTVCSIAVVNSGSSGQKPVTLQVCREAMSGSSAVLHLPGGMRPADLVTTAEGCAINLPAQGPEDIVWIEFCAVQGKDRILHAAGVADFAISDFGAKPGESLCTDAFRAAFAAAEKAGGGRVVVPAGRWMSGAIHLRSNTELHLAAGARIVFSQDAADYLPAVETSWEGMECWNYSPLVYAYGCTNVAITGAGELCGFEGELKDTAWASWVPPENGIRAARRQLYDWGAQGVPVAERQIWKKPNAHTRPHLVQFNRCRGVRLEDFRVRNSPFWTIHLYHSRDVVVRGLDVRARGINNDGVDVEMTKDVLVENCRFDQGDDGVVIKSGRNQDAWRLACPTENVHVRNCTVVNGHGLLCVGSEISGGVRNVLVEDSSCGNVRYAVYVKTNRRRGGTVEGIRVRNCRAGNVSIAAVCLETDVLYEWADFPTYEERLTKIRDIEVDGLVCENVKRTVYLKGDADAPVENVRIRGIRVDKAEFAEPIVENVRGVRID